MADKYGYYKCYDLFFCQNHYILGLNKVRILLQRSVERPEYIIMDKENECFRFLAWHCMLLKMYGE